MNCSDCGIELSNKRNRPCKDGKYRCKKCSHIKRNRKYLASEKGKAYQKNYSKENSEKIVRRVKKWARKNPERRKEIESKHRKTEKFKEGARRRRKERYWNDPEYHRMKALANIHGVEPKVLKDLPKECALCGSTDNLTVDHMFPVCRGGKSNVENLQTLCGSCNSFKGSRLVLAGFKGVIL